jgi:hypothetical protein
MKVRHELTHRGPNRLVADLDPALRQRILDVPDAEREPEIQPDGVADNGRCEPVALSYCT